MIAAYFFYDNHMSVVHPIENSKHVNVLEIGIGVLLDNNNGKYFEWTAQ